MRSCSNTQSSSTAVNNILTCIRCQYIYLQCSLLLNQRIDSRPASHVFAASHVQKALISHHRLTVCCCYGSTIMDSCIAAVSRQAVWGWSLAKSNYIWKGATVCCCAFAAKVATCQFKAWQQMQFAARWHTSCLSTWHHSKRLATHFNHLHSGVYESWLKVIANKYNRLATVRKPRDWLSWELNSSCSDIDLYDEKCHTSHT